ncbi:MAG: hypothetical protein WBD09_01305 [Halobacteriota archaeon]
MGDKHTTLELKKELAEREGVNVEAFLRRVLEFYPGKPRSAAEVLELVKQQTGRKPKLLKSPPEVFKAGYKEEGLL